MSLGANTLVNYRLSPTDLVYLYDNCRRCFAEKLKNGLELPRSFSHHFTNADRAMREALYRPELIDLGVGPRFNVISQGVWVESKPIEFTASGVSLSFRGQYDALIHTDDGELWVVDYKTTTQEDGALTRFRRQLSCYVEAIENPAIAGVAPTRVSGMALIIFEPSNFVFRKEKKYCGLYGKTRWLELERRDDLFRKFLGNVAELLGSEDLPVPGEGCGICQLRFQSASGTALKSASSPSVVLPFPMTRKGTKP